MAWATYDYVVTLSLASNATVNTAERATVSIHSPYLNGVVPSTASAITGFFWPLTAVPANGNGILVISGPITIDTTQTIFGPTTSTLHADVYLPLVPAATFPIYAVTLSQKATAAGSTPAASASITRTAQSTGQATSIEPVTPFTSTSTFTSASTSTRAPISVSNSSNTFSDMTAYSATTLAGVAVGCALGAAILTAIGVFFCIWKRKKGKPGASKDNDKQLPLLPGHGQAVYTAGNSSAWEKHLPQADADSAIRSMASSTLDQFALHVENFYGPRSNIILDSEHQFELETIDASRRDESVASTMLKPSRTTEKIKHYLSSYIISMINFEDSSINKSLLPKSFHKQWQPPPQDAKALTQAHSQWRVLTAYLRQQGDNDKTYTAERDAIIDTAATHICKAFEPWAKADHDTRFRNLVGIMKRASELGIHLFSQPGRFEWQWHAGASSVVGAPGEALVILPGLYKTTDQNAVPLPTPLRLVEPVVAVL